MASGQTDKNTTIIRVYKYGLIPKGPFPEEAVTELWRANKLWNNLVAIHKQDREDFEEARCNADAEYKKEFLNLKQINHDIDNAYHEKRNARMQASTKEASHPLIKNANAKINALTKQRNAIYEQLKSSGKKADKLIDKVAHNKEFRAKINRATNAKHTDGMYSNTAWEVNAYFKTARDIAFKTNSQLRFHRFDGTGFFNFRFRRKGAKVDGVYFEELFLSNKPKNKNNARLLLIERDDTRRKTRILMRATLAGGQKIATQTRHEFDLIYHRPIPEGSQIQNGKIIRSRIGDKFSYHLALTVKQPVVEPVEIPTDRAVGIDIGFRRIGDTIQVATIASSNEAEMPIEVFVPDKMMRSMEHVIELQSDIDDTATELGKIIKPIFKKNPLEESHPKFGLWKAVAKAPPHVTLSFETAYKLARWILREPEQLPEKAETEIKKWWRSNSRHYREMHNLKRKQLNHRKHFYRQIAYELVSRGVLIVLEKINLSDFAETKDTDNKLGNKARSQRFLVSPSEFRNAIINAASREGIDFKEVPPHYTSKTCSACGFLNKELTSQKQWNCPNCGVIHDRDINAARNIANLGMEYVKNRKKGAKDI